MCGAAVEHTGCKAWQLKLLLNRGLLNPFPSDCSALQPEPQLCFQHFALPHPSHLPDYVMFHAPW